MSDEQPVSGSLASQILGHYAKGVERERLFEGRSQLERVRTQELLARHLPPPPEVILDVGGGPGVYARWLANQGYEVHLVDPVPLHVEQASLPGDRPLASARKGDARHLERPPMSVDAVLLMRPHYHLSNRADRLRALREARRVVRRGGLVFAVGISRFTSLLDGVSSGFLDDPTFARIVDQARRQQKGSRKGVTAVRALRAPLHGEDHRHGGEALTCVAQVKKDGIRGILSYRKWSRPLKSASS
jgi:ubiquinone/menaquinone biosynthesis C-methylase UbiE